MIAGCPLDWSVVVASLIADLARSKRYWLPPLLLFVALLVYLAWKASNQPSDAFEYRAD